MVLADSSVKLLPTAKAGPALLIVSVPPSPMEPPAMSLELTPVLLTTNTALPPSETLLLTVSVPAAASPGASVALPVVETLPFTAPAPCRV